MPLLAVISCSGNLDSDTYQPQMPYTLSVDKTSIESDGRQVATFCITDAQGKILTDNDELMSKIYFKDEATGKRLTRRTRTFKSVEDGEYTFSATVSGDACANTVTITSSGRSRYEVFRKNVALYRFTATWCQNCPSMTQGLERVSEWTKGRIVELGLHGAGSTYALSDGNKYVADYLIKQFKAQGFPSCVYDLDLMSDARAYSDIEEIIFNRIADAPTSCGIRASSALSGDKLTVSASVKTSTGGKYDIGFAILRDNCIPGAGAYEDEYDNVVVTLTGNYENMSTAAVELQKDQESGVVQHDITFAVASGAKLSDYSLVVFALKQVGNEVNIDNIIRLPLNASADYEYNR